MKLKSYMKRIRLTSVEVEVIEVITNGAIPKMGQEEHTQLNKNLEEINEELLEESECALHLSKNLEDHYHEDTNVAAILESAKTGENSNVSSVDPDTDGDPYYTIWD